MNGDASAAHARRGSPHASRRTMAHPAGTTKACINVLHMSHSRGRTLLHLADSGSLSDIGQLRRGLGGLSIDSRPGPLPMARLINFAALEITFSFLLGMFSAFVIRQITLCK